MSIEIDWTGRDGQIIRAAMQQMMIDARYHANAAGQDKSGEIYHPGAVEAYLSDVKDLERLLGVTRNAAPVHRVISDAEIEDVALQMCSEKWGCPRSGDHYDFEELALLEFARAIIDKVEGK